MTGFVAKAEMPIRRPAAEVFEAFADPAIASLFWFPKGSGRLEPGGRVRRDRENCGFSVEAAVKAVEPGRRILVRRSAYHPERPTPPPTLPLQGGIGNRREFTRLTTSAVNGRLKDC